MLYPARLSEVNRRAFLTRAARLGIGTAGLLNVNACQYWPHEGMRNACSIGGLPQQLREHELVKATWADIDGDQVWDCHTHLVGTGDNQTGIWLNPNLQSLLHPIQYAQFKFYLDGSCAEKVGASTVDAGMVKRLLDIHQDLPAGFRFMLLAFEYAHDEKGAVIKEISPFHTPNAYALRTAKHYPAQFEWIASIHPYRQDSLHALGLAIKNNARAVKWLPNVMGIDPSSTLCDPFYQALVKNNLPLLTHVGAEHAVDGPNGQAMNNPLLYRRALEMGVRIIFAHCASLGQSVDIDKGANGPMVSNLDLFARLMSEHQFEKQLYGDLAAITQINRSRETIKKIVEHDEWHDRLIYGSDYPLPGVMPVFSPQNFVDWGYLPLREAQLMSKIRHYNPILFDVMLKRRLKINGHQLSPRVFESRRVFSESGSPAKDSAEKSL